MWRLLRSPERRDRVRVLVGVGTSSTGFSLCGFDLGSMHGRAHRLKFVLPRPNKGAGFTFALNALSEVCSPPE
jgi:hypothetical protein